MALRGKDLIEAVKRAGYRITDDLYYWKAVESYVVISSFEDIVPAPTDGVRSSIMLGHTPTLSEYEHDTWLCDKNDMKRRQDTRTPPVQTRLQLRRRATASTEH